ncbi:MAG: F0F1 ATP synthase subunit A [Planctomycetes bacterium]|nr:F0F1 ATP synthase subunit A [Planctomycetota bacterium]
MINFSILASGNPINHLLEKSTFLGIKLPDWLWMDWTSGGLGFSKPVIYMVLALALAFFVFRHIAVTFEEIPNVSTPKKPRSMLWLIAIPLWPVFMVDWLMNLFFQPGKGRIQAVFEPILLFIRNDIVVPNLKSDKLGDKFLPFFWSLFFFILFCNLIGLTPLSITPTGQISVTATLAGISLITIIGAGMWQLGALGYWKALVPHDISIFVKPLVFLIEIIGLVAKPFALAIRLLANMTGGHVVLFVLLTFAVGMNLFNPFYGVETGVPAGMTLGVPVMIASVLGAVALMVFEVIVSLVQAYVFTLLTAIFVGMAINPEH